jgi:acyl dehydratase
VSGRVVLDGLDAVRASVGTALGPTEWVEITQQRLDEFAAASPGAPTGWLLLSMTNLFMPEMVTVTGVSAGLNIGTGEVRFGPEVAVGSRVRATGEITSADEARGGVQTTIHIQVESDQGDPLVEVDALSRWLP